MLHTHALVVARARSRLAALADQASSIDASSAYEHVLIELDHLYADDFPSIHTALAVDGPCTGRAVLYAGARGAVEELGQHGLDLLSLELLLVQLEDARDLDGA